MNFVRLGRLVRSGAKQLTAVLMFRYFRWSHDEHIRTILYPCLNYKIETSPLQPESFVNIWNLRGMLSNAYSKMEAPAA